VKTTVADIVIVNHNTSGALIQCVESIFAITKMPYQIIVVDNASQDDSVDRILALRDPRIRLIRNHRNLGFAKAVNQGIKAGMSPYIFLLNADVRVTENWLYPLIRCFEKDADTAVIGPKLIDSKGRITGAGVVGSNQNFWARGFREQNGPGRYDRAQDCISVSGAVFGIRRSLLDSIGYFDENYFMYYEDTDYAFQARSKGYRVVYCPASTVYHEVGQSPADTAVLKAHFEASRKYFNRKWRHVLSDSAILPGAVEQTTAMAQRVIAASTYPQGTGAVQKGGKFTIIRFGIIDWSFRMQRPQHLLKELVDASTQGFYINARFHGGPTDILTIEENLHVLTLHSKDDISVYTQVLTEEQIYSVVSEIKSVLDAFQVRTLGLIVDLPFWYPVAERLRQDYHCPLFYDLMDDHGGFSTNGEAMLHLEQQLLRHADGITCSSQLLLDKANERGMGSTQLIRNACEYAHFAAAQSNTENHKQVTVGYYGAIAHWFDANLVELLARKHPEWKFVLAGAITQQRIKYQLKLDNVELLGEIPYAKLPEILSALDLCLIPFQVNALTLATNPVKLYEYLAAGKPVLTTDLPEIHAIIEDEVQRRIEFAKNNQWEARGHDLKSFIRARFPMVSVIVIGYGDLGLTTACLESIAHYTDYPNYEVVLVDNGLGDDVHAVLKQLPLQFQYISTSGGFGFAAANNVGMHHALGDYMILLNNDTVVSSGWMTSLVHALQVEDIGLVCPSTDNIGNEAKVDVDYVEIDAAYHQFAWTRYAEHRDEYLDLPVVPLFCGAFSRKLIDSIGGLDEQFGTGMFEDDDFSLRVREHAGLRTVCSEEAFIHHVGKAFFSQIPQQSYHRLFETNRKKWEAKWQRPWIPHRYRS
jgi:GT2 family glycosyltransferase/glycosyltransferase involved in cell wall biosynthesis